MSSILQDKKECYFKDCNCSGHLDVHHVMNGPLRKKSEKWGGVVYICRYHHTMGGKNCVHENAQMRLKLKKEFERNFKCLYGEEMYHREFPKSYE